MKIKIIGPENEPSFKTSLKHLLKAVHELQADVVIDEVTERRDIENYGPVLYPVIMVNERLVAEGRAISLEDAIAFVQLAQQK